MALGTSAWEETSLRISTVPSAGWRRSSPRDDAGGAGPVLHDDPPRQEGLHAGPPQPRGDVGRAAGRIAADQGDRRVGGSAWARARPGTAGWRGREAAALHQDVSQRIMVMAGQEAPIAAADKRRRCPAHAGRRPGARALMPGGRNLRPPHVRLSARRGRARPSAWLRRAAPHAPPASSGPGAPPPRRGPRRGCRDGRPRAARISPPRCRPAPSPRRR